ncbi:two-component system response regulator [Nostocales cyanobacterium HT-58-2]|nr:two-component system response regulator [Nostocales cyanobacterium HT-58-2]
MKRVLVIDDERNLCLIVKACLECLANWEVLTSQSGSEGLLLAQTKTPNAILLDVLMPEMDGLSLLGKLQSHPITQEIPVILLTARVHKFELDEYAQLNIAGIVTKPFDPLNLAKQVAQLLGWLT